MAVRVLFVTSVLVLLFSGSAHSEELEEIWMRLMSAKSLKCEFNDGGTSVTWTKKGVSKTSDKFGSPIHLDSIDIKNSKARMIGNQGAVDVVVIATPTGLNIIEQAPIGNITFTTIFPKYKPYTKQFYAVTSRHMYLMPNLLPSQYYGSCELWE